MKALTFKRYGNVALVRGLGTVRGDAIEKAIGILKPRGKLGSLVGPLELAFARADGQQLDHIGRRLEMQRIRPVIDRVFPFEQAKEALFYLGQGQAKGKVVVQMR